MNPSAIDHEQTMREACLAGRMEAAATLALKVYSEEILSFLVSRLRSLSDAQEVFSAFAEDLWVGLPAFAWRCSMRTWAYTLARNAAARYVTRPERRNARNMPLSVMSQLSIAAERARSVTYDYQKSDVKDRFRQLRDQLDPEDQTLLVLRVDRRLPWRDLAIAMSGDVDLDEQAIERESARLRKAFERVKRELKQLAAREGLLDPDA
jgi:RNA polymerase sigma-70 factor, ECF subfamily